MPAYIALVDFTDKGTRNAKQTTDRTKAPTAAAEKLAPIDEEITALTAGSLGKIRTQTLRVFSADEVNRIFARIA